MQFNSLTFLMLFACVLAVHCLPFLSWKAKKINLLIFSYLFYTAWNPPFIVILWFSTIVDWYAAKWIGRTDHPVKRRMGLFVTLSVNLGLLAFFKYSQFAIDNFIWAARFVGIEYKPLDIDIVLPIGISFYTFQTLSYTIDVYRRKAKPWNSMLDFALYVTFFPQLVAGPIVRAVDFLPQCIRPRYANSRQFAWGINLLLLGIFQKVVIADGLLAPIVERVYSAPVADNLSAWFGTLAFAGQIFCDFAGYSSCAIGVAMCLGFDLPDNFHFPYGAIGFSDFWRRWHITLSTWLRDYLYIPLGGNQNGAVQTYRNLLVTMLIGGLWHGASWSFVVWGGLHGFYLASERWLQGTHLAKWFVWRTLLGRLFLMLLTFALVNVAWVFFRANSLEQGIQLVLSMAGLSGHAVTLSPIGKFEMFICAFVVGFLLAIHWVLRDTTLEEAVNRCPMPVWVVANAIMFVSIVTMPGEDRAFIYFQF